MNRTISVEMNLPGALIAAEIDRLREGEAARDD